MSSSAAAASAAPAFEAFAVPLFAGAAERVLALGAEPLVLGRGALLGVHDKNVSRTQAQLEALPGGRVRLVACGLNPLEVSRRADGGRVRELERGASVELVDEDEFALLPGAYRFRVEVERVLGADDDAASASDATEPLTDEATVEMSHAALAVADADMAGVAAGVAHVPKRRRREPEAAGEFNAELAYQFVDEHANQVALGAARFDPAQWLRWFAVHSSPDAYNDKAVRGMRLGAQPFCSCSTLC